ncbi:MAG: glycosyltransferase family 2 protein [Candidatus Latescibacterota bacterium]|nr:glycosyltransferase family 2 protein [Candidatus Latescibacterota bacterium]
MKNDLTVIVPALNEELHIRASVKETLDAVFGVIEDYEIIVFNDGSSDRTGEIADEMASNHDRIRVVHHSKPMGLGYSYKEGVRLATKSHVLLIPGDNELRADSLRAVCCRAGASDILVTYFLNPEVRSKARQAISKVFAWIVRSASGVDLTYFNGPSIHRTHLVRRAMEIASDGFTYQAEILARLIQSGATYEEVGMYINARPKTSAFRLSNVVDVFKGTLKLVGRVALRRPEGEIEAVLTDTSAASPQGVPETELAS